MGKAPSLENACFDALHDFPKNDVYVFILYTYINQRLCLYRLQTSKTTHNIGIVQKNVPFQ